MEQLNPCPFCGEPAESDSQQAYRALTDGKIGYAASVYCTHCPANLTFCYDDARDMCQEDMFDLVVEWWNNRASSLSATPNVSTTGESNG
jgi:hypothetical protein